MPHLNDPKHEKFACLVAETNKITESFRKVFKPKGTKKSVNESASKLAAKVRPRIEEVRREYQEAADKARILTKTEAMLFLSDVVRTPIGSVDETHPLCQELHRARIFKGRGDNAVEWENEKIKLPGKIDAVKTLAAMQGWNAKEEHNITLTASEEVGEALAELFQKKRG